MALYTVLGSIVAINFVKFINALKVIRSLQLGATIAAALKSAFSSPASIATGGIAGLAIGAALTAFIMSKMNKAEAIQDGIVGPQGGLMLSGPKGSVTLDSADTVVANKNGAVAGTDLLGSGALVQEMRQMKAIMTQLLNKNVDVYLDSDKVGTSLNIRTVNIQ